MTAEVHGSTFRCPCFLKDSTPWPLLLIQRAPPTPETSRLRASPPRGWPAVLSLFLLAPAQLLCSFSKLSFLMALPSLGCLHKSAGPNIHEKARPARAGESISPSWGDCLSPAGREPSESAARVLGGLPSLAGGGCSDPAEEPAQCSPLPGGFKGHVTARPHSTCPCPGPDKVKGSDGSSSSPSANVMETGNSGEAGGQRPVRAWHRVRG